MTDQPSPRLMKLPKLAATLGTSEQTLRNWMAEGKLSCRVKGTRFYDHKKAQQDLDTIMGIAQPADQNLSPLEEARARYAAKKAAQKR